MPPERRRRGPYKQYLIDPQAQVPKTTLWDRLHREENQHNLVAQQQIPPLEDNHYAVHIQEGALENNEDSHHSPAHDSSESSDENSEIILPEDTGARVHDIHSSSDTTSEDSETDHDPNLGESDDEDELHHGRIVIENLSDDSEDDGDNDNQYLNIEENFEGGDLPNQQHLNMDIDEEGGRRPLYGGSQISVQESDMLIMSFIIRWGLEEKCIEDLLRLIDCHMPAAVLGSKYLFLKKFPTGPSMQVRYFCRDCSNLLPLAVEGNLVCDCEFEANVNDIKGDGNYFIQLSISEQIQNVMENGELVQQMRKECRESDVISGKIYKRLRARGWIGDDDITLQWNTDGVKPFKSSKACFWPVQACINELPLQTRRDNMLLCGLYYGKGKPDMNVILKPFINELKSLHEEGVACNIPGRQQVNVKVHTLLCSVDSVARPMLQGIKQFNGQYGCSFCLRRGRKIERGRGTARVYVGGAVGLPRTVEQHIRSLECLEHYNSIHRKAKTHIQGVMRGSVLLLLPVFSITRSFVPDYMHATLEGVVATFWKHWTSSENEGMPWYLSKQKRLTISKRLEKIRPPVEITRPPRNLDEIALWKASEIKSFLVYYSLACLKGIFPRRYLKHWFLFVYSITVFLKEEIVREEFLKAQQAIVKFVEDIIMLYPTCPSLYTFNTHLLLHVSQCVEDFGALWASSTFPYQHFNGVLTRLITETQGVPTQVCQSYLRLRFITRQSSSIFGRNDCSEAAQKLYKNMLSKYHSRHSQAYGIGLRVFGAPEIFHLSLLEKNAIEELLGRAVMRSTNSFRRMIINGKVFHASVYGALSLRDNSIAQTTAGLLVSIYRILLVRIFDSEQVFCVALCNEILRFEDELYTDTSIGISSHQLFRLCRRSNRIVSILPSSILNKCVGVPSENDLYVMPIANSFERD